MMLPIPKTRLLGLYASFSLMTMFTAYIIAILRFSEFIPCSCGGVLSHMSWIQHLWFNVAFIFFALTGIILQSKQTVSQ
jgi:methylamine utilization protein MauE